MTVSQKVIWSEGMFLQPVHFQQQEIYWENLLQKKYETIKPYGWGIKELQIDKQFLPLGKFSIKSCSGIFPDGTFFEVPIHNNKEPLAIDVPIGSANCMIYMGVPLERLGSAEFDLTQKSSKSHYRYEVSSIEVCDCNKGKEEVTTIEVGHLSLQIIIGEEAKNGFSCIGLARIAEVRSDQTIVLDESYLPPCLNVNVLKNLTTSIRELIGLLNYRGNMLRERVVGNHNEGISELSDFLLLQLVNRYEPLLRHVEQAVSTHPEEFYKILVQLLGEISIFSEKERCVVSMPQYLHHDLQATFVPLLTALRNSLSFVLEGNVVALKMEEKEQNLWVSVLADKNLLQDCTFILAVYADLPSEDLRINFPAQVKVSPIEQIKNLVHKALSGIGLYTLTAPPRKIPYHSNFVYFRLDKQNQLWKNLERSAGFAFHVGGIFPNLRLELWAIRNEYYE